MWSVFLLIFLMLCAGFAGWLFFLWAVKSGQYDDIEGPKYRMMEDEEENRKEISEKKKNDDGKVRPDDTSKA